MTCIPSMFTLASPLVVWRLLDGKPGHESQSLGLALALSQRVPVSVVDVPVAGLRLGPLAWLWRRFPAAHGAPCPHLLIGAGHSTHWPLLCARRARGGRAVALMTPSLPAAWFDVVVAPEHDRASGRGVIATRGVLNAMRPGDKKRGQALVLVGGESRHFRWSDDRVMTHLDAILSVWPDARVTDSRRTPASLRDRLARLAGAVYQPWDRCPPGWLASQLAVTDVVWVTEDSVSMIYESLTAGCAVGLITLARPAGAPGRLVRGIEALCRDGLVTSVADWKAGRALRPPTPPLQEADRVAEHILQQLINTRGAPAA